MLFERRVPYEAWELLDRIDQRVYMHWIWGGGSDRTGSVDVKRQTSYRREGNSSNVFHAAIGHMVSYSLTGRKKHVLNLRSSRRKPRIFLVCHYKV